MTRVHDLKSCQLGKVVADVAKVVVDVKAGWDGAGKAARREER